MKVCGRMRLPLSGVWAGLLLIVLACAHEAPERDAASEVALSTVNDLRGAHRLADRARSETELFTALHAVEAAFESHRGATLGAQRLLMQDLADRAAKLCLALDRRDEALSWLERGLELTPAPSLIRANLLLTKADVFVAQGKEAASREVLLQALQINQALLAEELKDP